MIFKEDQVEALAPKTAAFKAGQKISKTESWESFGRSERSIWGVIKGSGSNPYFAQIDLQDIAYKCSCPSRQFPCKHSLGLMLIFTYKYPEISEEPEWVEDWINRRKKKANKITNELPEKKPDSDKAKEKRIQDRMKLVDAGVNELGIWLGDIVRVGILELQRKPASFFKNMSARMIDAKASGLASWVKYLGQIDYSEPDDSFRQAINVLGKLNLLVQTWKNYQNLSPIWQTTIKNLIGWNQSSKELMNNTDATAIKDEWLVIGQENETIDDLRIQRNWLFGTNSGRFCIILQFATRFSIIEDVIIPGSIIEAEIAYFPAVHEQRAIIKMQKGMLQKLNLKAEFLPDLNALVLKEAELAKINPWLNNQAYIVQGLNLVEIDKRWKITDRDGYLMSLHPEYSELERIKWLLISGGDFIDLAFVREGNYIKPLGIFQGEKYTLL